MSPSKKKKSKAKKKIIIHAMRQFVADANPDALFLDPPSTYDFAIIGRTYGPNPVAVYDYQLLVYQLTTEDGITEDEAIDHIEYNIIGSVGGENYPIITSHDYVQ